MHHPQALSTRTNKQSATGSSLLGHLAPTKAFALKPRDGGTLANIEAFARGTAQNVVS
jgi:hypothetical protein